MEKHSFFARPIRLALIVISLLCGVSSYAERDAGIKTEDGGLEILKQGVREVTLSNGVRVLLFRRGLAPVFSGVIGVRVGGVDEAEGETGIAHLLEHMAFKGTRSIGTKDWVREEKLLEEQEEISLASDSGTSMNESQRTRWGEIERELEGIWDTEQFTREYEIRGGVGINAATSSDWTKYYVSLPSNQFEYWCWLESERLIDPVMRQVYKERDVVLEERRMRVDDSPTGSMYMDFLQSAFSVHRYRRPVIGYEDDIRRITATQLRSFHKKFYVAENIVVSAVGDIDLDKAIPTLERYFGRVTNRPPPPRYAAVDPVQKGERRFETRYPSQPIFAIGFPKPNFPHPDDPPLSVLEDLLAGGRTSVLHRELVLKLGLANDISVSEVPGYRYPNSILFFGSPKPPHTPNEVEAAFNRVIERVQKEPFPVDRIGAAVNRLKVGHLSRMSSNGSLADDLVGTQLTLGNWRLLLDWFEQVERVTPEDVQRVAQEYLLPERRTVGTLVTVDGHRKGTR